jgi:hypothetical protein
MAHNSLSCGMGSDKSGLSHFAADVLTLIGLVIVGGQVHK